MFLAWISPLPVIALLTLVIAKLFGTVTPGFGLVAIWLGLLLWSAAGLHNSVAHAAVPTSQAGLDGA